MSAPFVLDRPDLVHRAVCAALKMVFDVTDEDLRGPDRAGATSWPRQVGMFVMAVRLDANQTQTARYFGRDRTTVTYAVQRVEAHCLASPVKSETVNKVERAARIVLDALAAEEAEREARRALPGSGKWLTASPNTFRFGKSLNPQGETLCI